MGFDRSKTRRTAEKHLSRGKITAAIEEYRKLVEWNPTDLSTLNTLGDLYARVGLKDEAKRIFSRVAQGYRHQGFTSKAIALLKKVARIDSDDLDSAVQLAECYLAQGLPGEAGRQYANVAAAHNQAGREDKALDAYRRMAEIDPSNASLQLMLGDRWQRDGQILRAHECFMAAGDEYNRQGNYDGAVSAYLRAQCVRPDEYKTLEAITSICVAQRQADKAIPVLRESLTRDPGNVELLRIMGSTYLSAGLPDDAEDTYQKLFALDAGEYGALLVVGEKFLERGDLDRAVALVDGLVDPLIADRNEQDAVDLLRKILSRDPEHPAALRGLALIFRRLREDFFLTPTLQTIADAALRRGDRAEAIEALEELCSIEPQEPAHRDALQSLGVDVPFLPYTVYPAAEISRTCVSSDESNRGSALCTVSDMSHRGQDDKAMALLQSIIRQEPDNLEFRLALKNAYSDAGLMDLAANECVQIGRISVAARPPVIAAAGSPTSSQHLLALHAQLSRASTAFEFVGVDNQRRASRVLQRVPLVVISDAGGWREFTETVDISELGVRLKLTHSVAPMTLLCVSLAMENWPDTVSRIGAINQIPGIVRYCRTWAGASNLVGIEFGSESEQISNITSLDQGLTDTGDGSASAIMPTV